MAGVMSSSIEPRSVEHSGTSSSQPQMRPPHLWLAGMVAIRGAHRSLGCTPHSPSHTSTVCFRYVASCFYLSTYQQYTFCNTYIVSHGS